MNNHDRFWVQFLPIVIARDYRLQVHTISETKDNVWEHIRNLCAKCQADWLLEESKK
jgi:hypothetical protein